MEKKSGFASGFVTNSESTGKKTPGKDGHGIVDTHQHANRKRIFKTWQAMTHIDIILVC